MGAEISQPCARLAGVPPLVDAVTRKPRGKTPKGLRPTMTCTQSPRLCGAPRRRTWVYAVWFLASSCLWLSRPAVAAQLVNLNTPALLGQAGRFSSFVFSASGSGGIASPLKARPVLVLGATGKVGRLVVQELVDQKVPVRALVRNASKASEVLVQSPLVSIFEGDINDDKSVYQPLMGCDSVIAVSGTVRISQLVDFLPWRLFGDGVVDADDLTHPKFCNYLAIKRLAEQAVSLGVRKMVRLTGLTVGLPAWNPVTVLFSTLLSLSSKWHARGEEAIRQSGIDYTVLRPGGLSDDARPAGVALQAVRSCVETIPPPARVGRADLAALCVASVFDHRASNATLNVRWVGATSPRPQGAFGDGSDDWAGEFEKISRAPKIEPSTVTEVRGTTARDKKYGVAVAVLVYTLLAVAVNGAVAALTLIAGLVAR